MSLLSFPPAPPWSAVNIYLAGCRERHGPRLSIAAAAWLPSPAPRTWGTAGFLLQLCERKATPSLRRQTGVSEAIQDISNTGC